MGVLGLRSKVNGLLHVGIGRGAGKIFFNVVVYTM